MQLPLRPPAARARGVVRGRLERVREAEVDNLRRVAVVTAEQDVLELEVAVRDALLVQMAQASSMSFAHAVLGLGPSVGGANGGASADPADVLGGAGVGAGADADADADTDADAGALARPPSAAGSALLFIQDSTIFYKRLHCSKFKFSVNNFDFFLIF